MLSKLISLIAALSADPAVRVLVVGIVADAIAALFPKLRAWGLTSHRVAYLRDVYRAIYPRLAVALPALWKAVAGAKHPEVEALLERVASKVAR